MNIEMRDIKRMLDELPGYPQNLVSIGLSPDGDVIVKTDAGLTYLMTDYGLEKERDLPTATTISNEYVMPNPDDYETPWTPEMITAGEAK